jgi:LacI family transcriptional regulator
MPDKTDKRPTLRSLAAITGLGISTVSQALRNSPDIAQETRNRVHLAAQQAGYRPNRAGVRLRTGKSNVITLVLNAQDGGSGFFANIVYGISDALKGTAYHLVVTPYSLSDPMEPVRYIVETSSADGVIFSRTQPDDPRVRYLVENGMPFASHGRTNMGIEHAWYDYDNEACAYQAVSLLARRGRQRIALIAPPSNLSYYHHALKGFERALSDFDISGFVHSSVNTDAEPASLRDAGFELTQRKDRPDGAFCVSSSVAPAIIAGFTQGGMVLGRDYDIVAKPMTELISMSQPGILGIDEDFRKAGQELARMVIARIAGTEATLLQRLYSPTA